MKNTQQYAFKYLISSIFLAFFTIFSVFMFETPVKAIDNDLPYKVTITPPAQQIDKASYFKLKGKPNEQIKLKVNITNNSKAKNVSIMPTNASTSNNLTVDYSDSKATGNGSGSYKLTDLITSGIELHLNAHESRSVTFVLTMPPKEFNGVILGAIRIADAQNTSTPGFVTAVSVKCNDNPVKTNMILQSVVITQKSNQPYFKAVVSNNSPKLLVNEKINAQLLLGKEKIASFKTGNDRSIAPNSDFNLMIPYTKNEALKPGKYTIVLNNNIKQSFTLNKNVIDSANKQFNLKHKTILNSPTFWVIMVVLLIIVVLFIILKFNRQRSHIDDFSNY